MNTLESREFDWSPEAIVRKIVGVGLAIGAVVIGTKYLIQNLGIL